MNYRATAWIIFAIALAVRLAAVAASNFFPALQRFIFWGDASGYSQLADNLLVDGSFHFNGGPATAFRMPGYPLFLAITYASSGTPILAQVLQVTSDLAVIYGTFLISEHLFGKNMVSLIAIMLMALNPLLILSTVTLYPESLGVLCTTCALLIFIRSRNSLLDEILVGVALGAAIYLKTGLLVVALWMLFIAGAKGLSIQGARGFIKAVILPLFVIGLMLLPWAIRNRVVMDHWVPMTTSNGDNLYRGNNPAADGGAVSEFPDILPGMTEIESSQEFSRLAWEWVRADPMAFLNLLPLKAGRFVWPLALSSSGNIQAPAPVFAFILLFIGFFYLLVIAGAWMLYRSGLQWELTWLLAPFFSLLGLSLVTYGGIRYSIPAQPGLAVLFSAGLAYLLIRKNPGVNRHSSAGKVVIAGSWK